jgi:hypothetical protein
MNQMVMTNRYLNTSFSLSRFYYQYSHNSGKLDYWQPLAAFVPMLEFWEDEIERKGMGFSTQRSWLSEKGTPCVVSFVLDMKLHLLGCERIL